MTNKKQTLNVEEQRHSLSHILATAVQDMFPEAKFAIGPAIENGFYYDFELPRTLIPEDLPLLEENMREIIKADLKFERSEVPIEEAISSAKKTKQVYKEEILSDLKAEGEQTVTFFKLGDFVDLCKGPHVESTGKVGAFKLHKVSGAYWKGDEKRQMLQRVYGLGFGSQRELDIHLEKIEEAEKRDHKKLGRELDLFSFHPEAPGAPFWHQKGMIIWNELEKFGKGLRKKYGNQEIQTPVLAKAKLWETSGHWDHYKEEMFNFPVENETYAIKPMDCPFNIKIYQTSSRSYKELPIRYTETGRVMRNEKSGQLNGLFRVRQITQDDGHIFCTEEQVESEIISLIQMVKEYYKVFGISPVFYFSTRPDDFLGEKSTWDGAEKSLEKALNKERISYEVKEGDGAFYGPKIDIDVKDALDRDWQLATIQLDFQLPGRFGIEYIAEDGKKKTPVMVHAAIFGSFERFIGIMTEHFGGAFPLWLSPVQVTVLPISDEKHGEYAKKVTAALAEKGLRVELDDKSESLGKRIRENEMQKVPYILVVGDKEKEDETVTVRERGNEKQEILEIDKFVDKVLEEVFKKSIK